MSDRRFTFLRIKGGSIHAHPLEREILFPREQGHALLNSMWLIFFFFKP